MDKIDSTEDSIVITDIRTVDEWDSVIDRKDSYVYWVRSDKITDLDENKLKESHLTINMIEDYAEIITNNKSGLYSFYYSIIIYNYFYCDKYFLNNLL